MARSDYGPLRTVFESSRDAVARLDAHVGPAERYMAHAIDKFSRRNIYPFIPLFVIERVIFRVLKRCAQTQSRDG